MCVPNSRVKRTAKDALAPCRSVGPHTKQTLIGRTKPRLVQTYTRRKRNTIFSLCLCVPGSCGQIAATKCDSGVGGCFCFLPSSYFLFTAALSVCLFSLSRLLGLPSLAVPIITTRLNGFLGLWTTPKETTLSIIDPNGINISKKKS